MLSSLDVRKKHRACQKTLDVRKAGPSGSTKWAAITLYAPPELLTSAQKRYLEKWLKKAMKCFLNEYESTLDALGFVRDRNTSQGRHG